MNTPSSFRLTAVLFSSLLFAGCDGSDGGPGGNGPLPADNQAPTVTAAEQDPVMELSVVTLAVTANDPDGDDLTFAWQQTGGAPVELSGANTAQPAFTAPKVKDSETLVFELTVDDGNDHPVTTGIDVVVEEASGVVYGGVEEVVDVDHVYFHHPAFDMPRRLSADVSTEAWLDDLQPVPDHKHVAYTLETPGEEDDFPIRLFVAALDGSGASDLTGAVVPGGDVDVFQSSPDGHWIAFTGDLETDGVEELFVVPVDGSEPRRKISGDIPDTVTDSSGVHSGIYWSPDSTRLLFGGELRVDDKREVFVAPVTGETRVSLSLPGDTPNAANLFDRSDRNFGPFAWSHDGQLVALLDHDTNADVFQLAVARADGSDRRVVFATTGATTANRIQMTWSPQGRLGFTIRTLPTGENDARELYLYSHTDPHTPAAKVGGASDINDDGDLLPDGRIRNIQWSPNGDHLAFTLERTLQDRTGLFVVPADAIGPEQRVRIDGMTDADDSIAAFDPVGSWLADGSRFVFGRRVDGNSRRLFSNTATGDALTELSGDFADDIFGVPADFCLSPDGQNVVFNARVEDDAVQRVYRAGTAGGGRHAITGDVIADDPSTPDDVEKSDADFVDGCWSPDGKHILISGDLEQNRLEQLFVVPADSIDGRDRVRVSNLLEETSPGGSPFGVWRAAFWVGPDQAD